MLYLRKNGDCHGYVKITTWYMVMAGNRWRGCSDPLYVNSCHNGGQLLVLSYFISVFGNIYHPFLYLGCWEQPCMILGLAVNGFGMVWMDMVWWCMCLGCSTAYQRNTDGSKSSIFHIFHWWMRGMKMHFQTTLMFKTCNCPPIHAHCAHAHVRFWGGEGGRWLGGCVFQSEWQLPKSNALAERETQYLLCVSCPWKKTSRQQRHQHISPPKCTDCNWLVVWNIF